MVPTAMIHKGLDSEKGANAVCHLPPLSYSRIQPKLISVIFSFFQIQFLDVLVGLGIEYKMEDTHRLVLKAVGPKLEIFIDRSTILFIL
jgi:hypothetical protein